MLFQRRRGVSLEIEGRFRAIVSKRQLCRGPFFDSLFHDFDMVVSHERLKGVQSVPLQQIPKRPIDMQIAQGHDVHGVFQRSLTVFSWPKGLVPGCLSFANKLVLLCGR